VVSRLAENWTRPLERNVNGYDCGPSGSFIGESATVDATILTVAMLDYDL